MSPRRLHDEHRFCKDCLYPLRGLAPVGTCPECGRPYDMNNPATCAFEARKPSPVWMFVGVAVRLLIACGLIVLTRTFLQPARAMQNVVIYALFPAIILILMAMRIHRVTMHPVPAIIAGTVVGALAMIGVPSVPTSPITGACIGFIAGVIFHYLQTAGWIE